MATRKIADFDPNKDNGTWNASRRQCRHPEHNPPSMMVYSPGVWEHTCPGCSKVTTFTVHPTHLSTKDNTVVQPQVRPMECTLHVPVRPSWAEDDPPSNPMHAFGQGRGD